MAPDFFRVNHGEPLPNERAKQPPSGTPTLVDRLTQLLDRGWIGAATSAVLVALVAGVCGYLLTPVIYTQRIPYVDESSLSQISTVTVKAQRDYDIPDEETTNQKRTDARAAVKPVYRYDTSVLAAGLERTRVAFGMMRDAALAVRSRVKSPDSTESEPPPEK